MPYLSVGCLVQSGYHLGMAWIFAVDQAFLWHHPFVALHLACEVDVWLWVFLNDLLMVLPSSDVLDVSFGLMDDY